MPLDVPRLDPCSFCEYLAGRRPYALLHRDSVVAILVTHEQRGQGHVLVIPVEHRETVLDLSPHEYGPLMQAIADAARAIVGAFDPSGVVTWQNNGVPAHQSVPHVHFHVAGTLPEGGTDWGEVPKLPVEETEAIAARLRPHFR